MSDKVENQMSAAELAEKFHIIYERLAPEYGYKTNSASAKPFAQVPEHLRKLMIAVCGEILVTLASSRAPEGEADELEFEVLRIGESWVCSFSVAGYPFLTQAFDDPDYAKKQGDQIFAAIERLGRICASLAAHSEGVDGPKLANVLRDLELRGLHYDAELAKEGSAWECAAEPEPQYFETLREAIDFRDKLTDSEGVDGWVRVEDRLPPKGTDWDYLVWHEVGEAGIATWIHDHFSLNEGVAECSGKVTHWRRIPDGPPAPPKEPTR